MTTENATATADEQDTLELDMTPAVYPVRLKGRDGLTRLFEIRDITGRERDTYLTAQARKVGGVKARGGKQPVIDLSGYQSSLIALCLWDLKTHVNPDGTTEQGTDAAGEPARPSRVPQSDIDNWPARIQRDLYKKCEMVSGLETKKEDEDEEAEGNG